MQVKYRYLPRAVVGLDRPLASRLFLVPIRWSRHRHRHRVKAMHCSSSTDAMAHRRASREARALFPTHLGLTWAPSRYSKWMKKNTIQPVSGYTLSTLSPHLLAVPGDLPH